MTVTEPAVPQPTGAAMSQDEYERALMAPMTAAQRHLFLAEMLSVRKDESTAILFGLFLGGLGGHRFYLKDMRGIIYVVFCWTFIPVVVSLVELFVLSRRVTAYNKREAYRVASRIRAYTEAAALA